jgi:dCMP deaminase
MKTLVGSNGWDLRFLDLARHHASWSKDLSTKVGAVIVGPDREVRAAGFNGFPRGVNDDDEARHQRPAKYFFAEHAERNAIYNAVRTSVSTMGCTIYIASTPDRLTSCADCARGLIQSGMVRVVYAKGSSPPRWSDSCDAGALMLAEAGLKIEEI